jgi:hypothetical protein
MTKNYFFIAFLLIACSCNSYRKIGSVNMISTRNIDSSIDYEVLTTYSGGEKKEIKKSKAKTVEQAVDEIVKKVAGGEYLMNVKIYLVKNQFIAVEGDIWGKSTNAIYKQFKVGDKVSFKKNGKIIVATIKSLKDDLLCIIELEDGELIEMKYIDITKIE